MPDKRFESLNLAYNQAGGQIGGQAIGSAYGGPIGGQIGGQIGEGVGSVVGGLQNQAVDKIGGFFKTSRGRKEHEGRNKVRSTFLDLMSGITLPDGSTPNFSLDAHDGLHDWKYADKQVGAKRDGQLFAYDTDYTNDLDYLASMGGISLSRLLGGEKGKAVDQFGSLIGNQALGSLGYGKDFTRENFQKVMDNTRAMYSKAGVQNKEEMLALSNQMLGQGRIDDTDHAVMQQTAGIVFDNDFNLASQLMSGRSKGLESASKSPSGPVNRPGRIYSPLIGPEEAMMSIQPLLDIYQQSRNRSAESRTSQSGAVNADIASGVALASGLYSTGNQLTGGQLGTAIKGAAESLGGGIKDVFSSISSGIADIFS